MNTPNRISFHQRITRLSLGLLLGLLPMITSGCLLVAAGAAGAGAVVYVRGELESLLDQPYPKVVEATRAALKDLEYARNSEKKDALEAELIYRTALDKKVTIRINRTGDKLTKVRIRIDLLGDEKLSKVILERIQASL